MGMAKSKEPVRLTQTHLDRALTLHANYLQCIKGGQRLSLKLADARTLDFECRRLDQAEFVGTWL